MTEHKKDLVWSWGKSMYGGWYASYYTEDGIDGIHAETLTKLKKAVSELGMYLNKSARLDN